MNATTITTTTVTTTTITTTASAYTKSRFASEYLQSGAMVCREGYGHVDCGIFSEIESRLMFDDCVHQCIEFYNKAINPENMILTYPKIIFAFNKNAGLAYFHIDNYKIWHLLVHLDENGEIPKEQVINPDFKMPNKPIEPTVSPRSLPELIACWPELTDYECDLEDYENALEDAKILINKEPVYKAPERKLTPHEHSQLVDKRRTDAKFEYYNLMKQRGDERFINMEVRDVFNLKLSKEMDDKVIRTTSDKLAIKITAARVSAHERKDEIKACELFAFVPLHISDADIYNVMSMHNTSHVCDTKTNRMKFPYVSSNPRARPDGMRALNVVFDYHTRDARFALLTHTIMNFTDATGRKTQIKFMKSKDRKC
jgi:hypothetical protein